MKLSKIDEFEQYINYCRKLAFDEPPDYDYLFKLFCSLQEKTAVGSSAITIDWSLLKKVRVEIKLWIEGQGEKGED